MSGVVKLDFNQDNLLQALASYAGKTPSDSEVIENLIGVSRYAPRSDSMDFRSREELINAIHKAEIFPADSPLPQQIADAFDWVIRRPAYNFNLSSLVSYMENNHAKAPDEILHHIFQNPHQFTNLLIASLNSDFFEMQKKIFSKLVDYVHLCFRHSSIEFLQREISQNEKGISQEVFNELESEFGFFNDTPSRDHNARMNLLKLLILSHAYASEKISRCFEQIKDPDHPNSPYLDILSGHYPFFYLSSMLASDHNRSFILLDKSSVIRDFWNIVNELTEGNLYERVKFVHKDIYDYNLGIQQGTIGTVRLSNVPIFLFPRSRVNDPTVPVKIQSLWDRFDQLLKPGGKIILGLRPLDDSQTQPITVDDLKQANENFMSCFKYFRSYVNSTSNTQGQLDYNCNSPITLFIFSFLKFALNKGYVIKIGHTNQEGNFVENETGFDNEKITRDTELVLIKPGA